MIGRLLHDLRYRARALFRRSELERELDDELHFHLEQEAAKYRAAGLPAAEAMRQARLAFGAVESVKEASRDGRGLVLLEHLLQDLRYAARSLGRTRGFTVGVMLTLALGIGANTAMFTIVDHLLFQVPAYLRQPDQVHRVYLAWRDRGREAVETTIQYTRYLDLRRWTTSFSQMAGYSVRPLPVGTGAEAREMPVATVSAALFDFFDARPVLGRFFTAQEDTVPVGAQVAVLGYGYWQAQYAGRPDVLGRQLEVGTVQYTIIGVAPRNFVGIAERGAPVVFVPITAYAGTFRSGPNLANYYTRYNWGWMQVLARRKPGVTVAQASADLGQAFTRSWEVERSQNPGLPPTAVIHPRGIAGPVQAERGPRQSKLTRVAAWISGVALIVLLVACANVANLMLARSVRRRREIALRLALGVSRRRLFAQLLTECLLLAGGGALLGLALAHYAGAVLHRLFVDDGGTGALTNARSLAVALVLSLVAGCLTGLAPILQTRRTDLAEALKAGARDGGYRRSRTRTALLLLQAALSVVLLVGAGLFVQSLRNVRALRLGYDVDPVLYIYPNQRGAHLGEAEAADLRRRLLEATSAIPGVERAALGLTVPFWDTWEEDLFVPGIDSVSRLGSFTLQGGSPEYFATMGTRILRGRGITPEDRADSPRIMVVSQSMARTLWPGRDALGQCVHVIADTMPCTTVVGVAEDIKQDRLADDPSLHYYLPITQYQPAAAVIFARVRGRGTQLEETVRRALQPLMPGDGYITVTPMSDIVGPEVRSWELGATMFLLFGGLALVLAAVGLYSVIAYDVAQRTHELGVRIALGARMADVTRLVIGGGLRVALIGVAAGAGIALAAGRWIAPLLFDQSPRDPRIFAAVSATLLLVAAVASALPALRAARVDPTEALKGE